MKKIMNIITKKKNTTTTTKQNDLFEAVKSGDIETVKLLLEQPGADINVKDNLDNTLLHLAARQGNTDNIKLLLDKRADVNAKNCHGEMSLHLAARQGNLDTIKLLLDKETDVNAKDEDGNTFLHKVVHQGNSDNIRLLLNKGADINAKSNGNNTPLHIAVWKDNINNIKLLLEHRADVNVKNNLGNAPLHIAANRGNNSTNGSIHLLLNNGADINAKNNDNHTALHIKIIQNRGNITEFKNQMEKISKCDENTDIKTLNATLFYDFNIQTLENADLYIDKVEQTISKLSFDKLNDLLKIYNNSMFKLLMFMRGDYQTNPNHIFNWADEEVIHRYGLQNLQKLLNKPRKKPEKIESSEENDTMSVSDDLSSSDDSNQFELSGEESNITKLIEFQ